MKTSLVILASVLLVLGMVGVVYANDLGDKTVSATVTVNAFKDVTVSPCASPLAFGGLNPGSNDNPVSCAAGGDVVVTNNPSSNGDVKVELSGTDFSDGGTNTFAVGQNGWDKDDTPLTTTAMKKTGVAKDTVEAALTKGNAVSIYFFLDVPAGQAAAAYSSTFTLTTS